MPSPLILVEHRDELRQHAGCPPEQWGAPAAIAKWLDIQADNLQEALDTLRDREAEHAA